MFLVPRVVSQHSVASKPDWRFFSHDSLRAKRGKYFMLCQLRWQLCNGVGNGDSWDGLGTFSQTRSLIWSVSAERREQLLKWTYFYEDFYEVLTWYVGTNIIGLPYPLNVRDRVVSQYSAASKPDRRWSWFSVGKTKEKIQWDANSGDIKNPYLRLEWGAVDEWHRVILYKYLFETGVRCCGWVA